MDRSEYQLRLEIYRLGKNLQESVYDPQYIWPYINGEEKEILESSIEETNRISSEMIQMSGVCKACRGEGMCGDGDSEWVCKDCEGKGFVLRELRGDVDYE